MTIADALHDRREAHMSVLLARMDLSSFIAGVIRDDLGRKNDRLAEVIARKIVEREFGKSCL